MDWFVRVLLPILMVVPLFDILTYIGVLPWIIKWIGRGLSFIKGLIKPSNLSIKAAKATKAITLAAMIKIKRIVDREKNDLISKNVGYMLLSGILVSLLSAAMVGLFVW